MNGAIIADKVYRNGVLIGRDLPVTLPTVTHKTAEHTAMGTTNLPIPGLIDPMEPSITYKGYAKELALLCTPEAADFEIRFVQDKKSSDGSSIAVGCRAYMRAVPTVLPGGELAMGEILEMEVPLGCTRYQLFVDGYEVCLIDQIKCIERINGKDYAQSINSLL